MLRLIIWALLLPCVPIFAAWEALRINFAEIRNVIHDLLVDWVHHTVKLALAPAFKTFWK